MIGHRLSSLDFVTALSPCGAMGVNRLV